MTSVQKVIKYCAIALAILLTVGIISGIVSVLSGVTSFFGKDTSDAKYILKETKVISDEVTEIKSLKVSSSAFLEIKNGDSFKVETNSSEAKYYNKDGNIEIKENIKKIGINNTGRKIIVYLPDDIKELDEVNLSIGAGSISVDSLVTKKMFFELGAGDLTINKVKVSEEAKIESGAGILEFKSGSINNLKLEMGVGEVKIASILTGNTTLEAGVGDLKLDVLNDKSQYTLKVEKGLGEIKLDGESISNGKVIGKGKNNINIEGGIGNIEVNFIK